MARRYYRGGAYRGRTYYAGASRRGFRAGYGKMGINMSTPFLVGALIGFTDYDKQIPGQLVLGAATAPIKGIGTIKAGAQGIIFGNLIQGIKNGGVSSAGFKGI